MESILICTAVWNALRLNSAITSRTCISEPLITFPVGAWFTAVAIRSSVCRTSACIAATNFS